MPHQNRSWPSTRRTVGPRERGAQLGDVAVGELVRLARHEDERRAPARRCRRARPSGSGRRRVAVTSSMPSAASTDAPYVSALIVIHGRRQIGTNAVRRRRRRGAGHRRRSGSGATGRARPARRPSAERVVDRADRRDEQLEAGGRQRVGVLAAVLLLVDHDEVGGQRHDRRDVGVLGAADVGQVGLLAEAGAGDDVGAERQQRLGRRRDQADDARDGRASPAPPRQPEQLALLVLELLVGQRATLQHALELLQLGGDVDRSAARRGARRTCGPRWRPSASG